MVNPVHALTINQSKTSNSLQVAGILKYEHSIGDYLFKSSWLYFLLLIFINLILKGTIIKYLIWPEPEK